MEFILKPDNKRYGIVMMLLATFCFCLMDGCLKMLAGYYPAMQVAALRALCSMPLIVAYVVWRGAVPTLWRVNRKLSIFRVFIGIAMLALFSFAVKTLPLSEAYALFFIAPIMIAALSIPILGERVSRASWLAIGVGLLGVLVVLKPSGKGIVSLPGLAVLVAATCYAFSAITVRFMSRTDSSESMIFWLMLGVSVGAGLLAYPNWVAIRASDFWLLVGLAISGFFGQLAITEAFKSAPTAIVTPFEYSALAWGMGLDLLIWQTIPSTRVLIGALIIVLSGVYLVRHEAIPTPAEHP